MAQLNLPFSMENKADDHNNDLLGCSIYRMMPKNMQQVSKENIHLLQYMHMVPVEQVGIPKYHPELTRKMSGLKDPNIVYPVGGGIFTHIYPDPKDSRDYYISVEPTQIGNMGPIMEEVEERLLGYTDILGKAVTQEDLSNVLLECVEKICSVSKNAKPVTTDKTDKKSGGLLGFLKKSGKSKKLNVTPEQYEAIKYILLRDKVGMGILEPLLRDPYIEDISCSGTGRIYIEHKIFKGLKTGVSFDIDEELDEYVLRMAERIKKPVTIRDPIVDATLPDGSRINIVYGRDVSKRGSNFTIRKFAGDPLSILELIEFGSISYSMAAYLSMVISEGMNIFVSGETASGKTTLMNAITTFIPSDNKIVTIEDTPELQVPHPNWIREVSSGSSSDERGARVGMFDLLKAALRQRPNAILIGEIRDAEGAVAFQAMQTGHQVMSTFHAMSVGKLIQRVTGNPINVPKTYIDALNVIVIQSAVRLKNGKIGRRCLSINEIVGYDSSSDSFSFIEAFRWNPETDEFEFTGNKNSYLLEQKIAVMRGLPQDKRSLIYQELERRAVILEKLHKEQKVSGFYKLLQVLAKAQKEGLF